MLFNSVNIYTVAKEMDLSESNLKECLKKREFSKIPKNTSQAQSFGWVSPLDNDELAVRIDNFLVFCLRVDEKKIPASALKLELGEKVEEFIERNNRSPSKKDIVELKERVNIELLKIYRPKTRKSYGYFDIKNNLLVLGESSIKKAEDLAAMLRDAMGSLPIIPFVNSTKNPSDFFSKWVLEGSIDSVSGLSVGEECKMDSDNLGGAKFEKTDITKDEVTAHIEIGQKVVSLGLEVEDIMTCVVDRDLVIKKIKVESLFKEEYLEQEDDSEDDAKVIKATADILITGKALEKMYCFLVKALEAKV